MTSAAQPAATDRWDVRTIVGGGAALGVFTTVGVVVFAMVSRGMSSGITETVVQSLMLLAGAAVFAYAPAAMVRPRSVDGIAWAACLGLIGALAFTVLDTAILRPLGTYHWTWDQIGGGSGFWYIPVWWMGSAFLAWLGSVVYRTGQREGAAGAVAGAVKTIGFGLVAFAVLAATGIAPFHPAVAALGFTIGLVVHALIAAVLSRQ